MGLRVEAATPAAVTPSSAERTLDDWRKQAIATGQRLSEAEATLKDTRKAANDLRERERKTKERLDSSQARVNDLQTQLVAVMAERDLLVAELAPLKDLRRKVWEMLDRAKADWLEQTS